MSNELAVQVKTIHDFIQKPENMEKFKMAMPSILTPERFIRIALTAINKTPKLAGCSQTSLLSCLMDCASLGIEPDGRRAHLIPYGNTATLIIDYKGLIELARRSGEVSLWKAELVCENDKFEYTNGTVKHTIDFKQARGEPYAVYSYVKFKDGAEDWEVMTKDEIEAIRKRSKAASSGPWVTDPMEMWKKTVIRRHSKRLPLSAEFRDALDKDFDRAEDITPTIELPTVKRLSEKVVEAEPEPAPETEPEPQPEPEPETVEPEVIPPKQQATKPKKQSSLKLEDPD